MQTLAIERGSQQGESQARERGRGGLDSQGRGHFLLGTSFAEFDNAISKFSNFATQGRRNNMARKHEEVIRVDHSIFEYIAQNPDKTNAQVADHFAVPYHRVDWAVRRLGIARKNGRPRKVS